MPPKRPRGAGASGAAPAAKRARAPASPSRRIEAAVLRALRNTPAGLAQDALATRCKVSKQELALALNALTQRRQLQLAKGPDGDILFMLTSKQDIEAASRLDELSTNELHVYQTIQDKARDGIWKRDIKHKTGLVEKEVEKILKTLQKKKLVKMEKTVLRQNGRMFFLYDIEPSAEHTGGVWYSRPRPGDPSQAPEFDTVGVKDIADACHKFVCNENQCRSTFYANHGAHLRNPSLEDIHAWVAEHKLYKEELALENIQQIMMTLLFDGKVERIERGSGRVDFIALSLGPDHNRLLVQCPLCEKLCHLADMALCRFSMSCLRCETTEAPPIYTRGPLSPAWPASQLPEPLFSTF